MTAPMTGVILVLAGVGASAVVDPIFHWIGWTGSRGAALRALIVFGCFWLPLAAVLWSSKEPADDAAPGFIIPLDDSTNCRRQHQMSADAIADPLNLDPSVTVDRCCEMPPSRYADDTGYSEVTVTVAFTTEADKPERQDLTLAAETALYADRIRAKCPALLLTYAFGLQGAEGSWAPIRVVRGTLSHLNTHLPGQRIETDQNGLSIASPEFLGFEASPDETVVLHASGTWLTDARCSP